MFSCDKDNNDNNDNDQNNITDGLWYYTGIEGRDENDNFIDYYSVEYMDSVTNMESEACWSMCYIDIQSSNTSNGLNCTAYSWQKDENLNCVFDTEVSFELLKIADNHYRRFSTLTIDNVDYTGARDYLFYDDSLVSSVYTPYPPESGQTNYYSKYIFHRN
tara:strand:- start:104 stop:586 length:483 start_codon:yes stop_codon:yes gene_type:complete